MGSNPTLSATITPAVGFSGCRRFFLREIKPAANISRAQTPHHRPPLRLYTAGRCATDHLCGIYSEGDAPARKKRTQPVSARPRRERMVSMLWSDFGSVSSGKEAAVIKTVTTCAIVMIVAVLIHDGDHIRQALNWGYSL